MKVGLSGATFYAYHGYYPEENLMGTKFEVDLWVKFDSLIFEKENIQTTVNYSDLYDIINSEMKKTSKLLESLIESIVKTIQNMYPFLQEIYIKIKKITPQLGGQLANTFVEDHIML
jgi:7,8-dihydroneopterin aldolase/epimerase/oxygenase